MAGIDSNHRGTSDTDSLLARVRTLTASPLLYIGAISIVVVTEIVGRLPLPEFWQALATLPVALAVMYVQVAALVLYRRRRHGTDC